MSNNKGDEVLARWPRSKLYYEGSIQDIEDGKCKILFKDGSEFWIKNQDIQSQSVQTTVKKPEQSRARSKPGRPRKNERSRSRSKSVKSSALKTERSRSKSGKSLAQKTERSRSRSRSRSRKTAAKKTEQSTSRTNSDKAPSHQYSAKNLVAEKSPAQKSLSVRKYVGKSPSRASLRISEKKTSTKISSEEESIVANSFNFEYKPASSDEEFDATPVFIIRREKSESIDKEKLNDLNSFNIVESQNNIVKDESKFKHLDPIPKEYGGVLSAALCSILLPLFVLSLYLYATMVKDNGANFLTLYKSLWNLSKFFKAFVTMTSFLILQVLLMALPFGKTVQSLFGVSGMAEYRCNGLLAAVLTVILAHVLDCYFQTQLIYDIYIHLLMTAIIFGIMAAVLLYKRASDVPLFALNPYGNTGTFLYDFWIGREINPGIGKIDFKLLLIRYSAIGSIVLNSVLLLKALHESATTNSLILCVAMQFLYYMDYMWFEYTFPTTFTAMYEGLGYLVTMGNLVYPFLVTFITKFIFDNRIVLPPSYLIGIGSVYFFGYMIYRSSNSQKSEFRRNIKSHAIAHLETIATNRGRKLLSSGYWGFVRHPNYLGDIIIQWSWTSLCGFTHWLPYVIPLLTTLYLLMRASRDNTRCKQRYNIAWDLYCYRVKYKVIPFIF